MDKSWYLNPIFSKYWMHYKSCMKWIKENGQEGVEFEIDQFFEEFHEKESQEASQNNPEVYNKAEEEYLGDDDYEDYNAAEVEESDEEVEVSEEYLQFIKETRKHQSEWEKVKRERLNGKYGQIEYIDVSKIDTFVNKVNAPTENKNSAMINAKKDQEIKTLYGEDCNMIKGMEAALSFNFNRLCDLHQPNYWPIIPIRLRLNQFAKE